MPLPHGSELIAHYAATRRLAYVPYPEETWFRQWEPYLTLTPPSAYYNACTWTSPVGHACIVEPWYAAEGEAPLERTVIGFAVSGAIMHRAAARVGEHFVTRVAFLEGPPLPEVKIGDALWDEHVHTFATSPDVAAAAFPPRLRQLLASRGFRGHIEMRARGGLVLHVAGLLPTPGGYDQLLGAIREIVDVAVRVR
jgi:hypothetical protein